MNKKSGGIIMICEQCGKEIQRQSKFCPKCGVKISEKIHEEFRKELPVNFSVDNNASKAISRAKSATQEKLSISKRILSIVICVFIVTLTIISSFVCVIRIGMQKETVRTIVSNEDILEIKVNNEYLSDYIISHLYKTTASNYNITTGKVDEILGNEQVNEMIKSLVTDYTSMFIFGEKPRKLNENTILKDIQSLDNLVYSKTGYHFTEQDYEDIRKELTNGGLSFLLEEKVKESLGIDPYLISMFFSIPAIIIFIAVDIGLIVLLFKVNDWKIKSTFAFWGVSWIVSGVLSILVALFMFVILTINQFFVISALLKSISITMLIIAAILLVVGLLFFFIQNKLIKTRR